MLEERNIHELTAHYVSVPDYFRQNIYFSPKDKILVRNITVWELVFTLLLSKVYNNPTYVYYGRNSTLRLMIEEILPCLKGRIQDDDIDKALKRMAEDMLILITKDPEGNGEDRPRRIIQVNMPRFMMLSSIDPDLKNNLVYRTATRRERKLMRRRMYSSYKAVKAELEKNKVEIVSAYQQMKVRISSYKSALAAFILLKQGKWIFPTHYCLKKNMSIVKNMVERNEEDIGALVKVMLARSVSNPQQWAIFKDTLIGNANTNAKKLLRRAMNNLSPHSSNWDSYNGSKNNFQVSIPQRQSSKDNDWVRSGMQNINDGVEEL